MSHENISENTPLARKNERSDNVVDYAIYLVIALSTLLATTMWIVLRELRPVGPPYSYYIDHIFPHIVSACIISLIITTVMKRFDLYKRNVESISIKGQILSQIEDAIDEVSEKRVDANYGGVKSVFENLGFERTREQINSATESISILNVWIPDLEDLKPSLQSALSRGIVVNIIITNPASPIIQLRESAFRASGRFDLSQTNVEAEIKKNLDILMAIYNNADDNGKSKLSVRFTDIFPPFAAYISENRIHAGFFWSARRAIRGFQLALGPSTPFGAHIREEFGILWKAGKRDITFPEWWHDAKGGRS